MECHRAYQVLWKLAALVACWCMMSCSDPYDAEQTGKDYCACIEGQLAGADYMAAEEVCAKQFASRNRYFRAYYFGIDAVRHLPLTPDQESYSLTPLDSFSSFNNRFSSYLKDHCPYSAYLKKEDSLRGSGRLIPRYPAFDFMRNVQSCREAEALASEHARKGEYKLIDRGLPDNDDNSRFYEKYLLDNYHIQIIKGGCVSFEVPECYDTRMRQLLAEKYDTATLNRMFFREPQAAYARQKHSDL